MEDDKKEFAGTGLHPGFPSPAQDYMNPCIDLNKELVRHPAATFYGRVVSESMADAGVNEGDILVIDRSIEPSDGDLAVCFVDGEFSLRRIDSTQQDFSSFSVWGVVTYTIKKLYRK